MAIRDPYAPSDEELDAFESYQPEEPEPDVGDLAYKAALSEYVPQEPLGALDRIALALHGNIPQVPTRRYQGQASGALPAILAGLAGGFSTARGQRISERQKMAEALGKAQHAKNVAALQATTKAQELKTKEESELRTYKAKKEIDRAEPGQGVVTQADIDAKLFPQTTLGWKRTEALSLATGNRAELAATRAAAAAERAAAAQERAAQTAAATTLNQLVDNYRNDKDITAYQGATQNLATMRTTAKLKSGPGDLALLIAYFRATEPGILSVVREQEFNNASKSVGAMSQFLNLPRQWVTGQRLTDAGRQELLKTGTSIANSRKPAFDAANNQYKRQAKRFGVDPADFTREYSTEEPARIPAPQSTTAPATMRYNPATGQVEPIGR